MRRSILLFALALAGCKARWPIEPSAPCDDAGFAMAARVHACTGDAEAANALFERFERETRCVADGNPDPRDFECSASITALGCARVEALGDVVPAWLSDPSCSAILAFDGAIDTGVR